MIFIMVHMSCYSGHYIILLMDKYQLMYLIKMAMIMIIYGLIMHLITENYILWRKLLLIGVAIQLVIINLDIWEISIILSMILLYTISNSLYYINTRALLVNLTIILLLIQLLMELHKFNMLIYKIGQQIHGVINLCLFKWVQQVQPQWNLTQMIWEIWSLL